MFFNVGELMGNLKHSEELKEKILAEIATGTPMTQLSSKYDIPVSTIGTWKGDAIKKDDEFENLRNKRKTEFVNNAWDLINDSMAVASKRIKRSKDFEENIDIVASAIKKHSNEISKETGLGWFDLLNLIKELQTLKNPKIGELTTLIGTMYDKQAVAEGKPTEIVEFKLEDFAE